MFGKFGLPFWTVKTWLIPYRVWRKRSESVLMYLTRKKNALEVDGIWVFLTSLQCDVPVRFFCSMEPASHATEGYNLGLEPACCCPQTVKVWILISLPTTSKNKILRERSILEPTGTLFMCVNNNWFLFIYKYFYIYFLVVQTWCGF